MIWRCHCSGFSHCCGAGSIPALATSNMSKKKKKDSKSYFLFFLGFSSCQTFNSAIKLIQISIYTMLHCESKRFLRGSHRELEAAPYLEEEKAEDEV